MTLWHIAWSYLWNRKLTTSVTILSVALAVGLISAVLTLREETRKRFEEESQVYDIVVGGKGSRLQLVLSTIYYIDQAVGNIPYSVYEALREDEDVAAAFPISLGDSYKGYRIVGSIPEMFEYPWYIAGERREPFVLEGHGRYFERPMEAVLGAQVARATGLEVGDTFIGLHGYGAVPEDWVVEDHSRSPYTVVGIFEPGGTPNDRAIFTSLESVWHLHSDDEDAERHEDAEHEVGEPGKEVTAVLIDLESPALRYQFEEYVNDEFNAMAVIPIQQINNLYNQLLETAKTLLLAIGYLVVVISALSILIGLYLSIIQRKRDMAIMRALGASAPEVFGAVMIEALLVTVLGIASGWVLGKLIAGGLGLYLSERFGLAVGVFSTTTEELLAFATVAVMGLIAGIIPAWQAYRTDVAHDLAEL